MTDTYNVAADEIRQFVERAESIEAQRKDLTDDLKDVFAEAGGRGYKPAVLKKVIALRKRDKDDLAEEEALMTLYLEALGAA